MKPYSRLHNKRQTAQSEQADPRQIENSAGGYTFKVDQWTQLDRFLILGSDTGTYYIKPKKLTKLNMSAVAQCLESDGKRTVDRIVEVSKEGLAASNDPAIFALAFAMSYDNVHTRRYAAEKFNDVIRIGTHLFHFMEYLKAFRGRGQIVARAIRQWYQSRNADSLAYQVAKYQSRDGWSHRDVLRVARPKAVDAKENSIFRWVVKGTIVDIAPDYLHAVEAAKKATTAKQIARLITENGLVRENIPTQWLNEREVWEALLVNMPMTAMVRNLGNMTKLGLFPSNRKLVTDRLRDEEHVKRSRIHPFALFVAMKTYGQGRGMRGSGKWNTDQRIMDALDDAFELSFKNVVPSGKRILIGLDVSGSMSSMGLPPLSCYEVAGAMALITVRAEENVETMAFCHTFQHISISPRDSVDSVVKKMHGLSFGGTDCALPMLHALKKREEYDAFFVYTDNETWAGRVHPHQALAEYRRKMVKDAKLVVAGIASNNFTIADPADPGMLDVVGFDTSAPMVMSNFIAGR